MPTRPLVFHGSPYTALYGAALYSRELCCPEKHLLAIVEESLMLRQLPCRSEQWFSGKEVVECSQAEGRERPLYTPRRVEGNAMRSSV